MIFFAAEQILFALWAGVILDLCFGEPTRFHPLAGFGYLVSALERRVNPSRNELMMNTRSTILLRLKGLLAWVIVVLPLPVVIASFVPESLNVEGDNILSVLTWWLINSVVLWFALGGRSLIQHLNWIYEPLVCNDLNEARSKVGWIVSRDTSDMDEMRVCRAGIESGLENGSDAIYAPLFWFIIAGAPGVLLYRLANTMDAMWGYKTSRFLHLGWASARIDDVLNYIPARITAVLYAVGGHYRSAWHCWRQQAEHWESPNAGPVMASGAGALRLSLGGGDTYHGVWKERPLLGLTPEEGGQYAGKEDLLRTMVLLKKVLAYWLIVESLLLILVMGTA
jgi:adenosylcobinamide-phosphate synthase